LGKKLNKNQITETNIKDSVDSILFPIVTIALRTSGHLLLGIVRIYSRKVKYFLHEATDAVTSIKLQSVQQDIFVNLTEKTSIATVASITLLEKIQPPIDLIEPEKIIDYQQITLRDFDNWEPVKETQIEKTPSERTPSEIETQRNPEKTLVPDATYDTDVVKQILGEQNLDFGGGDYGGGGGGRPSDVTMMETPESHGKRTLEMLPPPPKKKKLGELLIDSEFYISSEQYKKQLNNTDNLLRIRKFIPKTKEEEENLLKEKVNFFRKSKY